jgi:hypothetical protein
LDNGLAVNGGTMEEEGVVTYIVGLQSNVVYLSVIIVPEEGLFGVVAFLGELWHQFCGLWICSGHNLVINCSAELIGWNEDVVSCYFNFFVQDIHGNLLWLTRTCQREGVCVFCANFNDECNILLHN